MDTYDEQMLNRLKDTEDHFTERKLNAHEHRIREAMVAFANSAIEGKPGIIYIGVRDKGEIVGIDNPDKTQKDVSSWAASCFPALPVIPRVLNIADKRILAVMVPRGPEPPYFAKAAYKRVGAQNIELNQKEIDDWIAYRNSKVCLLLEQKMARKSVTVERARHPDDRIGIELRHRIQPGEYRVEVCNQYFCTFLKMGTATLHSEPMSTIDLNWDDKNHRLLVVIKPHVM